MTWAKRWRAPGAGPGRKLTDAGIARAVEVVAAVREAAGWDVSLCTDHFGHGYMTAKEVIRLGKAVEPFGLAWMEDPMPWWDIDGHKQVTDAIAVPTAAGEELYLWDGFRELIEQRAVDIIHPDLLTSGGMLETKKIADYAERYGMPTALHFAGSPIAFMANVHCAAAISSFVALEHHGLDLPFWESLVTGLPDELYGGRLRDGARQARAWASISTWRPSRPTCVLPALVPAHRRVEHAQARLLAGPTTPLVEARLVEFLDVRSVTRRVGKTS